MPGGPAGEPVLHPRENGTIPAVTEPILGVNETPGGWELRTTGRTLLVPPATMEAWLKRAGLTIAQVRASGCVLEVTPSGEARGLGWPAITI